MSKDSDPNFLIPKKRIGVSTSSIGKGENIPYAIEFPDWT